MKKQTCKKCKNRVTSMNAFKLDKSIYKHFFLNDKILKEVKELDGHFLCQECLLMLWNDMSINDYKNRGVEHLQVNGAYVPRTNILHR